MKCQSCGKKEATVRYFEDINGKKQELHFCIDCAKKLGYTDFDNLFSPMFITIPDYSYEEELQCKTCGYRLQDYSRTGFLGCPDCYETFGNSLDDLFYKIHGKNRHIKMISRKDKKQDKNLTDAEKKEIKLKELKLKIKELIEDEKYEEAAVVRDEIKKLEGK